MNKTSSFKKGAKTAPKEFKDKRGFMPFWVQSVHRGLPDILVKTEFEPGSKDERPHANLLSCQTYCRAGLQKSY